MLRSHHEHIAEPQQTPVVTRPLFCMFHMDLTSNVVKCTSRKTQCKSRPTSHRVASRQSHGLRRRPTSHMLGSRHSRIFLCTMLWLSLLFLLR